MRPGQNPHRAATNLSGRDYAALGIVALATALFALVAYRPSHLYFFGDTWDILCEFREQGWRTMWRMHNEHFMPVSKVLLYVQYQLFGMNNFPYQAVNIGIHAMNAVLLYVVAGELTCFPVPRVFGALFFAFSGVYWEISMWEAGQQTTLALLFVLMSLVIGSRYLRHGTASFLACTMLTALLASWSMGFGLLVIPLLAVQALVSHVLHRSSTERARAVCILPAAAVLCGFAVLLWSDRAGFEFARSRASVGQTLQVLPWTFTALRGLAASYASPVSAPLALGGLFMLAGLFQWRRFFSKNRLLALLVPVSMLLLPYALTAAGRVQLGMRSAASSRYQYLPAAALGLILAWLAGGIFGIVQRQNAKALFPLALVGILSLPLHALAEYEYLRRHNPMEEWGRQARRFVDLAIYRHNSTDVPAGMACVRPQLYLPAGMYPHPFFDLSRALPLYAANGIRGDVCTAGMASLLDRPDLTRINLLNGGARGIVPGKWTSRGSAVASFDAPSRDAPRVARIELQGVSAYGFETRCAGTDRPYSFAASVQLVSGDPAVYMRIVFKDAAGRVLDMFPSQPISSHDFSTVAVSGYPAPGSATVGVDFASSLPGSEFSGIAVRDAVLLEHPVYVPAGGHF
jgi:hypothetical protein